MLTFLGERQMKTRIGNVILEVTLIIILIASVGLADLSDGLVAYYPFNGNTNDESGNGNNGIEHGGITYTTGIYGQAISFSGNNYISLPTQSVSNLFHDTWTISLWAIAHNQNDVPSFGFENSGYSNKDNPVHSYGNSNGIVGIGDGSDNQSLITLPDSTSMEWKHYVIRDDGTNYTIYINGAEYYSEIIVLNPCSSYYRTFLIGQSGFSNPPWADNADYFIGNMDDFRIYNRALSPDEINEFINSPPIAICQDILVAVGADGYVDASVDGGSYDSDGDDIVCSQNPVGPYPVGVYNVELTVTDTHEASDNCQAMLVVYDPSDGFVTGGGWIWSPKGAYVADQWLEGKANFGFVAKYKKGANVPTGQTEFVFQAGDLNFHSSSYDWLVVAGAKAMFKGVGTINGAGNYGFMLSAIDAALTPSTSKDRFRIKIWDNNAGDTVVYDNQIGDDDDADVTTTIGGGSIVIHTK
jgi:hypothetical protein